MKEEELYETIEGIDEKFIQEAETVQLKKKLPAWSKLGVVAACLCFIVVGAMQLGLLHRDSAEAQQWSQTISARDYFKNSHKANAPNSDPSASLVMPPYAVAVSIDDKRSALEKEEILPVMPSHSDQSFVVDYNGDGSLYKVAFLWMRRGEQGLSEYSDLQFIASPKQLHELSDTIMVRTDEDGNIIPENETVTQRDGVFVYAVGRRDEEKVITWQTENGWYQIVGSWNDSYEDVVALLDWFWEHPLSLSSFEDTDGIFVYSNRDEYPEAFCEQIPDFSSLGYVAETEKVNLGLCEGKLAPVWFEGIYTRGAVRVRWAVSIGADADGWKACLGRPNEISVDEVNAALSQNQRINVFFDSPCMATLTIENGTASDAMDIIQTLQN